jgi:hypothetical protein
MSDAQITPVPDRVGQGTAVEQSRAAAEVLGAIEAAQRWPRDVQEAIRELTITCGMMSVAEKAFYSYPQADTTVEGPTVSLARYMALAWGHIHFGINELRRDDDYGQSEILSWAWDVQKGVRSSRIFILPHRAYAPKKGSKVTRMVDLREIQFNNLSVGGRNVRETMFAVMPAWFRERAERMCRETLTQGELGSDGKRVALPPLPERIEVLIDWYAGKLDVSERQLARKIGRPTGQWTVHDVVTLGNLGRSITSGEIQKAAAFPPDTISGAAIIAAAPLPESVHISGESTSDTVSPAEMHDQESQPVGTDH